MLSRLVVALTLTLALISQVHGHAVVSPALGIDGEPVRRDAQRPSRGDSRCGRVDVAENIDTSGTVTPAADGTMTLKVQNFNRGTDGSRQMTVMLDATGTGTSFNTPVTVMQNGEPRPREARGSDTLIVQMPQGVACTGGASGNKCLMSFESLGGFGNCVVVEQQQAAGAVANSGVAANNGAAGVATGAGNTAISGTGAVGNAGAAGAPGTVANNGAAVGNAGVAAGSAATSGNVAGAAVRRNIGGTRVARAVLRGVIS
ncbi:hypothetical protein VNI00_004336 [Paramarasmius palmivorus]|uniref:Uncharacterized protein n=1 Tax=Paramarasmius palmivorus TaxID=297713 RepID=A0AAW0DPP4_9AGAR